MATMRAMPTGTTMTLTPPNFPDPLSPCIQRTTRLGLISTPHLIQLFQMLFQLTGIPLCLYAFVLPVSLCRLQLSERRVWDLQVFESGLPILEAIKTKATHKFRTYYREILCPEYEHENQEGYWELISENVENALRGQSFLWKSDNRCVCGFQSRICSCSDKLMCPGPT